jgi:hypothetical protein
MALSQEQRAELDRLRLYNVQLRLQYAGPGPGSIVPGLLDGMVLRGDVEEWIAKRNETADRLQSQTLWWAKAAAWIAGLIGLAGIVVAVLIAIIHK